MILALAKRYTLSLVFEERQYYSVLKNEMKTCSYKIQFKNFVLK